MEPVGIGVFALVVAGTAAWSNHRDRQRAANAAKLRRELAAADLRISQQHREARRQMSIAAGQSWRNLAG